MTINNSTANCNELLFKREASMASMSIGIGLTHLRKYDFVQPGYFYSGLYSIATGIERLLKIILIYDYRLDNEGLFPDNKQLKNYGHKLLDLFELSIEINKKHNFKNCDEFFYKDYIYKKIIGFLSDFAMQSRYYNLDYLTGKRQNDVEPLERWEKEICKEITKRHYKPKKGKIKRLLKLGGAMEEIIHVVLTDEKGGKIDSVTKFMLLGDIVTTKQKYSMYYIYVIVRFLCNLCAELEQKGEYYPFLREYFSIFRNVEKTFILRKKSWNPNSPYKF